MPHKSSEAADMAYNRSVIPLAEMCKTCPEASSSTCNTCTKWHESEFKKGTSMTASKRDKMAEAEAKATQAPTTSKEDTVTTAVTNPNATAPVAQTVVTAITKTWEDLSKQGNVAVTMLPIASKYQAVQYTPFRRVDKKDGSGSFVGAQVTLMGMGVSNFVYFNREADGRIRVSNSSYKDSKTGETKWAPYVGGEGSGLSGIAYIQWKEQVVLFATMLLGIVGTQTAEEIAAL